MMLKVLSVKQAKKLISDNFTFNPESESVPLSDSVGRILAEDITARENIPSFNRSTVDGYALIAENTFGSSESMPAMLHIAGENLMGRENAFSLSDGECVKISTGGIMPENSDAVIMLENTESDGDGLCLVQKSVSPYENVTRAGDDIKCGETVLKAGTAVSAGAVGAAASLGFEKMRVLKRFKVGIISTGDELVPLSRKPVASQVRDINTHMLAALCKSYGCEVRTYGIFKDEYNLLSGAVLTALTECDAVLISGGSSAGTKDMTVKITERFGTVLAHGLAMKPGKPTVIGAADGKALIGLPGHPAAAFFVTRVLLAPFFCKMNFKEYKNEFSEFILKENIPSNHGREEYICVKTGGGYAFSIPSKSGIMSTVARADGFIKIDAGAEGLAAGTKVKVIRF